ncbi:hypothetical protein GYMLUDRAFT_912514 [Collybiopsis luxurians FD-317 M1]|nr:hypothetical protein GYMLUDRAFT_912514 [Collybiopsis luxurians FD-317 M1]
MQSCLEEVLYHGTPRNNPPLHSQPWKPNIWLSVMPPENVFGFGNCLLNWDYHRAAQLSYMLTIRPPLNLPKILNSMPAPSTSTYGITLSASILLLTKFQYNTAPLTRTLLTYLPRHFRNLNMNTL